MKPYYDDGTCTIYHGDCREILPSIEADVLVTDPPYGINYRTPPGRVRFPKSGWSLEGDAEPFDPSHLIGRFDEAVIFGANHFADRLPASPGWLIWDKRDGMPSNHQSDCEMAWTSHLGSVRLIPVRWNGGGSLLAENGKGVGTIHPTQKPLKLMRSVLGFVGEGTICDPYAGTGTTLRAAKDLGRKAIGIEIEEKYCAIAAERLGQEVLDLGAAA